MPGWESVGVIGAIVPWNFPLMLLTWKVSIIINIIITDINNDNDQTFILRS